MRQRRDRREPFGELVQLDGSVHEWPEYYGPRGCLINRADEATSTTLCRMGKEETVWAAVGALGAWMEKYCVPRAPYADGKNVSVREPTAKEYCTERLLRGSLDAGANGWGIKMIAAGSPEAKGRVERGPIQLPPPVVGLDRPVLPLAHRHFDLRRRVVCSSALPRHRNDFRAAPPNRRPKVRSVSNRKISRSFVAVGVGR